MEILKELSTTPLPVILVMCGIVLLVIAILPIKIEKLGPLSARQQKISAITGITFVILGIVLYFLPATSLALPAAPPSYKITITTPPPDFDIAVQLTDNGGVFKVNGVITSYKKDTNLRVIVLIHSQKPYVKGWWMQTPAIVNENGDWQSGAQIGSNYYPPHVGDELDVIALVVNQGNIGTDPHVDDINRLKPIIESDVIHLTIKEIR
jgi:hypothetical protein